MSSRLADYDYVLPVDLIATRPPPRREEARMMVLHRRQQQIEHRKFIELEKFLAPGTLLVLNNTRVLPARRFSDDGKTELLFLEQIHPGHWRCLVRPGKKMRAGAQVRVDGRIGQIEEIGPQGERIVVFEEGWNPYKGGLLPLPPYMERQSDVEDELRYQTVFGKIPGAIAAPTAGLHFTPEILDRLDHVFITLHVSMGTFRPVRVENVSKHQMDKERYSISAAAAKQINQARRIAAVGTTTVRALESARRSAGKIVEQEEETNAFIYPPYKFQVVDLLLTNFHLPRSTLLMLVSAFAGRDFVLAAYEAAIRERYRFFSYGDCMLII